MALMSLGMEKYFESLDRELKRSFLVAEKARSKGYDPIKQVDIVLAKNMAERVVGLISVLKPELKETKIVDRIYELEKQFGSQDWRVALTIAGEIAEEKFCKFKNKLEAMELGIRIGVAYITNGVVSSPLEGFTRLELKRRRDGGEYFCVYYSGPIRSAGGTAASVSLIIADYVRKRGGYKEYDISEEELKRAYTEINDYHERVTNLQYYPSEEEFLFLLKHLPVQVDGDPSEKFEVSNYKDLSRIKTNNLRNGPCLVLCEGLAQKASKVWKKLSQWEKDFGLEHWNFLSEFLDLQKKIRAKDQAKSKELIKPDYNYIKDLVAGRPVLGHPLRHGGFRLRYGRCRNSGFSSTAIHPATMIILKNFIGIGCQLKVERPGKATSIATCDSIEGPIVKLKNGNVLFVDNIEIAKKFVNDVEEILYLGDILINYGDFLNRAHILVPCGYNEEWYSLEIEKSIKENNLKISDFGFDEGFFRNPTKYYIDFEQALEISKRLKIPLHPRFTYHWNILTKEMFLSLIDWLVQANIEQNKIILSFIKTEDRNKKRILELLGVPHLAVGNEYVVIENDFAKAFAISLGFYSQDLDEDALKECCVKKEKMLEIINSVSEVEIRDKSGTFIGARMGRPEKGKMRKLDTSPHIIFSVGNEGGRLRSFQSAVEKGRITSEFPIFFCRACNIETIYGRCEKCDNETEKRFYCSECKTIMESSKCVRHGDCKGGRLKSVNIKSLWENVIKKCVFSESIPIVKGVRGTSNKDHMVEHLMKGVLRAKNGIYVNRDGTTRFDMTELVITHFKPKEIGISLEKLKQLGYERDIYGQVILSKEQTIEIKPQDIILPRCIGSKDVGGDEILLRVGNFIDDLFRFLYKEEPFYNFKNKDDLIGQLVIGLSPHTSAGVIGRILGFSDCQGLVAHPLFHSIMRRDCLHPNTKFVLFDADKKEIIYNTIGGYVEKLLKEGSKTKNLDNYGTKKVECKNSLYVFGADSITKRFVRKRVKYFIKGPLEKKWIKITTETNKELVMTLNHKFLYLDEDDNFSWKRASEIAVGNKLPILSKFDFDVETQAELDLLNLFLEKVPKEELSGLMLKGCESFFEKIWSENRVFIRKIWGKKGNAKRWCTSVPLTNIYELLKNGLLLLNKIPTKAFISNMFSDYKFPIKIKITKELMRIIGYYIAEGYSRESKTVNQVAFRICNNAMQLDIVKIIEKTFGCKVNLGEENSKITICHKPIYHLFVYCLGLGKNAYSKRLPNFIYKLPTELVCEFVEAYLDGNGSVVDSRNCIVFYSVCRSLLDDLALLLSKYGLVGRFSTTKPRPSRRSVLLGYKELGKEPKFHRLHHLVYSGQDSLFFKNNINLRDNHKLLRLGCIKNRFSYRRLKLNRELRKKGDILIDYVKKVEFIKDTNHSYCLDVDCKNLLDRNILLGEQIINMRCDGDESCVLLLMDGLLNFSNSFLPEHRGGKQDEPLVLSTRIIPNEVDDMVFDMDVAFRYPLEFYEAAQNFKFPWDIKIDKVGFFLGTEKQYEGYGFTHDTNNINSGNLCSTYKLLPTMEEKVYGQMDLAKKIRSVDENDVARLVLERHFIRDIKGNLRKFSTQQFRCVDCNEKFRRPPLQGKCSKCNGKLLFTVAEGSVVKYLEPSLSLIEKYKLSDYLKQTIELTKMRIESVFGKEADKQVGLGKWF